MEKLKTLQRINISSLPPTWNVDCHGVDCHDVDCRTMDSPPVVELPARKFVYETGPFIFHFSKYNDGYCTSKPADATRLKFFDAIHEKAWHLWSEHYQHRRKACNARGAKSTNTAFPARGRHQPRAAAARV